MVANSIVFSLAQLRNAIEAGHHETAIEVHIDSVAASLNHGALPANWFNMTSEGKMLYLLTTLMLEVTNGHSG